MALSIRRLEEVAPDQNSLVAARKLQSPRKWPVLGFGAASTLLWGECQGSGANPYRVCLDHDAFGYKCTCPSRKFPCKHVLALAWQWIESRDRFSSADVPDWVESWNANRRGRTATRSDDEDDKKRGAVSATAATLTAAADARPPDPEVEAERTRQAAARAAKNRERRHAAILDGLDALDRWMLDLLSEGVATVLPDLSTRCRALARRLVDAKAPGLAGRVDALPSVVFQRPELERAEAALTELGQLHLLAQAYRNQANLPAPLAADVRRLVGWSTRRDTLLADPAALRVRDAWRVVGGRAVVQVDDLRRIETWLVRESAHSEGEPRFALLVDYHPVSVGRVTPPYGVGDRIAAELVFYPSAAPLRALIGERHADDGSTSPSPGMTGAPIAEAIDDWRRRMTTQPWLGTWPLQLADVAVASHGGRLHLTDGSASLPISDAQRASARQLMGLALTSACLWDGEALVLMSADTVWGTWAAEDLVA